METNTLPATMINMMDDITCRLADRPKLAKMFQNCFKNTIQTTVKRLEDQSTFIITGDIPAMWLRDSAAQVKPYLALADRDETISTIIEGVIKRQIDYVNIDPYANAFNKEADGAGHQNDLTDMSDWIWERKYEIDSLCYPIQLSYLFWKKTGITKHFDNEFLKAVKKIIGVWKVEQHHEEHSPYRFQRKNCPPSDTLTRDGLGKPVCYTGMTWSGFRPSDDACMYGYLIPSNMFAVVVLNYMEEILTSFYKTSELISSVTELKNQIQCGINEYGIVKHPKYGEIYAYETDGFGHYNLMDDANVPSLLALPYLGFCSIEDEIYQNTRAFILSEENPYYFEGTAAKGIGSPHTPDQFVWHIALAIQGLTTNSSEEIEELLTLFETTDAGTGYMHEGFHVDDPTRFTRKWFSWANAMFCEFMMSVVENASINSKK
ncbi:glycoside hydrolase family 125 protein [Metabacillus halosaccharovorans]|uniref:glycoside hydrolase family 125 protein n=1 Tax=Metabacillus halosaccharovorans TaxID=930124 RepID=UPI002040BAD9|nr:glycoside hydrolase family 125 protein [Metabacillus halosaccharovorans]MCM3439393.1 glycoside hydrolase family 125 protein [Metabacillus halosaccharovorans]